MSEGRADFFNKMEGGDIRIFWNVDIIYQNIWRHNADESILQRNRHEEFKSQLSECVTALMLLFPTFSPSNDPARFLFCYSTFLHQSALSPSFSVGKTYSYSAGITKRAKGTRPWEKGKSMPVVTFVIRRSLGTNYAPTLRMEAVKAPDMSEHLC
jgi:hypothetical protein